MTIKITLQGSKELQAALENISDDIRDAVSDAVTATGLELRGEIVEAIQSGPATGTTYYRIYDPESGYTNIFAGDSEGYVASIKGQTNLDPIHTASAAGEAPMSDTGRLAGSVLFNQESDMTVTVGSNLAYSLWLEYGTIKMAPRPVWQPKAEEAAPKFEQRLKRALGAAIK